MASPLISVCFAALLGGVLAVPLRAQDFRESPADRNMPAPSPRPWSSLNPAQREVLAPLQDKWDGLPPRRQSNMLKKAEHWETLPPEKREEVRLRIAHWQAMTPEERQQAKATCSSSTHCHRNSVPVCTRRSNAFSSCRQRSANGS